MRHTHTHTHTTRSSSSSSTTNSNYPPTATTTPYIHTFAYAPPPLPHSHSRSRQRTVLNITARPVQILSSASRAHRNRSPLICRYFSHGFCRNGSLCQFSHSSRQQSVSSVNHHQSTQTHTPTQHTPTHNRYAQSANASSRSHVLSQSYPPSSYTPNAFLHSRRHQQQQQQQPKIHTHTHTHTHTHANHANVHRSKPLTLPHIQSSTRYSLPHSSAAAAVPQSTHNATSTSLLSSLSSLTPAFVPSSASPSSHPHIIKNSSPLSLSSSISSPSRVRTKPNLILLTSSSTATTASSSFSFPPRVTDLNAFARVQIVHTHTHSPISWTERLSSFLPDQHQHQQHSNKLSPRKSFQSMNSRYGAFARQTNVQQRSATANNATSNVKADNNNIRSNFNDNSNEIGHHDNSFASHITNVTSHRTSSSTATSKLMDYLSSATYFYGAPSSSAPDDNYNNRNNKSNMIHDGDANHDNESYIDPISLLPASLRDLTVSPPAHTLSTHTHTHQDTNSHAYALPPSLSPTFASTQNQNNSQHLFANSVSSRANVIQLPPSYSSVVKISNKEDATNNNNTPNTQRSTNVQPPPTTNSSASGKQTPHTQPSHIRTKVCPFFLKGNCRYGQYCRYKHNFGKVCPNCGKDCALDDDSQRRHLLICVEPASISNERRSSSDLKCGICQEYIVQTGRRFGLLANCDHAFCLMCIRTWRGGTDFSRNVVRSCPICRRDSHFIIPCDRMVLDPVRKSIVINRYKTRLQQIPCKHFSYGRGNCPFGSSCFYAHRNEDGEQVENPTRLRHRANADGIIEVMTTVRLSDYFKTKTKKKKKKPKQHNQSNNNNSNTSTTIGTNATTSLANNNNNNADNYNNNNTTPTP